MIKINCLPVNNKILRLLRKRSDYDRTSGSWERLYQPKILPSGRPNSDEQIKNIIKRSFWEKCGYCESLEANSIDHFWPRNPRSVDLDLAQVEEYNKTWDWNNFIWCCKNCQDAKGNKLPVNTTGHQMINPREEEPLYFLSIDGSTGAVTAVPIQIHGIEQRGVYTLQVLDLSNRIILNRARRKVYRDIRYHIARIIDERSSPGEIEAAWSDLQDDLDPSQPYLAVAYQLFTLPTEKEKQLLQRLYTVIPESYEALARFRRELPPYPEAD